MADKNVSTEYIGVYTGIFPNMSPREIELEARVKELKEELNSSEEWRIKAESLNEKLELRNTCYLEALEEIGGIIKSSTKDFNHIDWEAKAAHALTAVDKISDIINKAKDGE